MVGLKNGIEQQLWNTYAKNLPNRVREEIEQLFKNEQAPPLSPTTPRHEMYDEELDGPDAIKVYAGDRPGLRGALSASS